MTQKTPIPIGVDEYGLPILPNPQDLYDQIMQILEPELVSSVVSTLKEKYSDETPEEAKERAARYAKAFKEYDTQLKLYMDALSEKTKAYAHAAAKSFEALNRESELMDIADLESAIDTNSSPSRS